MHRIGIDRTKRLAEEPGTGHNRYHPDIEPLLVVDEGETVVLETRDGSDGQFPPGSTTADIERMDGDAVHPLTGPLYVRGAVPGDALEIEFLDIEPQPYGWSGILPGAGFLRDIMTTPFLVHWQLADGWATSGQIPGVRIPGAPFMGVSATAPSAALLAQWTAREQRLHDRGGWVYLPDEASAVPGGACGIAGLRTQPPRENGGNLDVKQLTKGARLVLPVYVDGALFSTGDAHFAQGDGEVCVTAVEMGATVTVRFRVHKGLARRRAFDAPLFYHETSLDNTELTGPQRFTAVTGMPISDDGENDGENLTLAARNAVLNMMELLVERGYSREQAYVICSVAVDLRVGNVVDAPNFVVTAILPESIFDAG